ncbi:MULTISPECIES: autotransporter outer membrane beta-barrel domain-containing protein [unclassified Campylobacter]|uniref:autotransporter outer membrane beta-barrel domain-containing protein n=1 Tax=unclassified Campylobacter TaxID=2593542 RepID=UPI003D32E573
MKQTIILSIALCCALNAKEFTYKGEDTGEASRYLKTSTSLGTNLKDFQFSGTNNNKLTFDYSPFAGSSIVNPQDVFGTEENDQDVYDNKFIMINGQANGFTYAAISSSGKAYRNTAIIENGTIKTLTGGFSNYNNAYENKVEIKGGTVDVVYGAQISGVDTNTAYKNTVEITGGEITNAIGASTNPTTEHGGDLYQNEVIISNGTIKGFIAGAHNDKNRSAYNNKVTIKNTAKIDGSIFGSRIEDGNLRATGNTVTIGDISKPENSKNKIMLKKDQTIIYGGYCSNSSNCNKSDIFSGNTLNLHHVSDLEIKNIQNFEYINFILSNQLEKEASILKITDAGLTDLSKTKIGVMMSGGINTKLNIGDKFILIEKPKGGNIETPENLANTMNESAKTTRVTSGVSKIYTFELKTETNNAVPAVPPQGPNLKPSVQKIIAVVSETQDNPKQKNIAETSAMMGGIVNEGSEAISGIAIKNANTASTISGGELANFGSIGGSNVRLNSGSHVDVKGFNFVAGISKQVLDMITYGAFIEYGVGNYDSYNNFGNAGTAHGKGTSKYIGAGLLAKFDLTNNYYTEASIRAGKIRSDYKSTDINPAQMAEFKSSRMYMGAHIGLGKIFEINDNQNLDIYSKFFITRLGADTIEVIGEKIKFHTSNSMRARIGTRYSNGFNDSIWGYAGAAFEREFNSDAKATNLTQNERIKSPTLKGNTAIGELGTKIQTPIKPLNIEINLQAMVGKREGVSGGINAEFKF